MFVVFAYAVLQIFVRRVSNPTPDPFTIEPRTHFSCFFTMQVTFEPDRLASITTGTASPSAWSGDLLVIGVFENAFDSKENKISISNSELQALDADFGGALTECVELHEFQGKQGSLQVVRVGKAVRYVALAGLGPSDKATVQAEWGPSVWQTLGGNVASAAKTSKAKTAAVAVLGASELASDSLDAAAGRVANGIVNGAYESTRFKTKPTLSSLESVELLFCKNNDAATKAMTRNIDLGLGALMTRYLVEAPPNVCTPTHLAQAAESIAAVAPEVMSLEVLEKEDCEKLGMGCYLGVAEASEEPPKFIHLTYKPKGEVKKKVAIVGKGLTFDSGGYNLKAGVGSMIEMMKFDMGGAGATLGAARAIAGIKPSGVEVHFIIASCENMVDGRGLRPGDILVASNGKTVEVNNTDAEGRLTLADALLFAQNQCNAEAIVDIATLTGACMIALGDGIGGMYAPTDDIASSMTNAAKAAGEKLWRLPLEETYMEQLKSSVADMKNTGTRMGGSITAALFLKEFVDTKKVAWSHLDIAGPVWQEKAGGATGFGAQLLAEWAIAQGE